MDEAKPFNIPKRVVWKAFKRVKANRGAAGVDKQSIAGFEADLSNNLYKLWNRMCSGSYFPPPVRRVEIPKADGGMRPLGIPTVADRIAQEVACRYLEPRLEPVFHTDSYGYRLGKSAIDAVRQARQRCWRYDWVMTGGPQMDGCNVESGQLRSLPNGKSPSRIDRMPRIVRRHDQTLGEPNGQDGYPCRRGNAVSRPRPATSLRRSSDNAAAGQTDGGADS